MNLVGKTVEWTSHAGRSRTTKSGTVIADKEQGVDHGSDLPLEVEEVYFGNKPGKVMFRWTEGWKDGLIVRVLLNPNEPEGLGNHPKYYAPRRANIRVVDSE